jgi:hypothetical protein
MRDRHGHLFLHFLTGYLLDIIKLFIYHLLLFLHFFTSYLLDKEVAGEEMEEEEMVDDVEEEAGEEN